ncbi:MAG: acyltransferase family protein [Blautia sp.]|nr:acyltransferase family protein [Blautia sp.]
MSGRIRERYLDVVKATGAVAIVALHTLSNTINAGGGELSDAHYAIVHVLHQFFYLAVPLFVLATGAGFLSGGRENSYRSMGRHIVKTVSCIALFGMLFSFVNILADEGQVRLRDMFLAVLTDHTWSHMWYLYRLLGAYLCMPLLSAFMNHTAVKEQVVFAGTILFFSSLYPYAAGLTGFIPAEVMPISGIWIFYLVMGGILGKEPEKLQGYRRLFDAGALLGMAAMLWESLGGGGFDESHPFVLLSACCLFAGIRMRRAGECSPPWLERLAQTALGVYVLHPVFIHICVRMFHFNPQYHLPILTAPLMVFAVYACSVIVVGLLRKIPLVRKYIL